MGTRPEFIKMCRVINKFDDHTNHILINTNQNFSTSLNDVFFSDLKIRKPDYSLKNNKSSIDFISYLLLEIDKILNKEKPDGVLIYGDTYSCLSAYVAKKHKIPIFHFEAGNRCFDQRVPEEINRKLIDHLSDINFTLTNRAKNYLIDEGVKPEFIFKSGSHLPEIINYYNSDINNSNILNKLKIKENDYFLVSSHRDENISNDVNFNNLINLIIYLQENFSKKVIITTHPKTRNKMLANNIKLNNTNIHFMEPFGFFDYIKLQKSSLCVISDSGTLTEESSIIGFKAIMIRASHERPEGNDHGTLVINPLSKFENIKSNVEILLNTNGNIIDEYFNLNLSDQVLRQVLSYIPIVNDKIWRK